MPENSNMSGNNKMSPKSQRINSILFFLVMADAICLFLIPRRYIIWYFLINVFAMFILFARDIILAFCMGFRCPYCNSRSLTIVSHKQFSFSFFKCSKCNKISKSRDILDPPSMINDEAN